ncbi:ATP synthase subunit I [bacterium]|nr:ATP synthase subunit I [bacterium]MBP9810233.1 ATP synthase subunit I [bacterium]
MTIPSVAIFILAIAAVVGVVLGLVFYGGLYWTVSRGLASKQPALWFLFSLLARVSIVLAGFYFVSSYQLQGSPFSSHGSEPVLQMERLISCLVTFTITGLTIRWYMRKEDSHASDS